MSQHAILPPSSSDFWFPCSGYPALMAMVPETNKWKEETDEGDAGHWVCETALNDSIENGQFTFDVDILMGQAAPNGILITQDMIDGARLYLEEVDLIARDTNYTNIFVESRVQTMIHAECYGTPDSHTYHVPSNTIHVWDYKFGHGDVSAFENKQLTCYFDGILQDYGLIGNEPGLMVHFHIVQPRCFTHNGPIKEWSLSASNLLGLVSKLSAAANLAMSVDAVCTSGLHCKNCPAMHECPSGRLSALEGISYQSRVMPEPLSDNQLSVEQMALDNAISQMGYRLESLRDETASRIAAGKNILNFSMQPKRSHRKFSGERTAAVENVQALASLYGIESGLVKPIEPVTPAEAVRQLKDHMPLKDAEACIEDMITRPSNGMKVVRDKGTEARRIFSKPVGE